MNDFKSILENAITQSGLNCDLYYSQIEAGYKYINEYFKENVQDVCVCTVHGENNIIKYVSTWFANETYAFELKSFEPELRIDFYAIKNFKYADITCKNYNLGQMPTKDSSILIYVSNIPATLNGKFSGVGNGCPKTLKFFTEKILPNIKEKSIIPTPNLI